MAIVPNLIKRNVETLLSLKVDGVYMSEFLTDYCNLHHEPLKFRDLGFPSLHHFLKSIPDVARIMMMNESESKVIGVATKVSYIPYNPKMMHSRQCDNSTKADRMDIITNGNGNTSGRRDYLPDAKHIAEDDWEPDHAGWWSVCFPFRNSPTDDSMALMTLFNKAGKVKQIRFTDRLVFVRYAVKEEAALAIRLFSHLQVNIAKVHKVRNKPKQMHTLQQESERVRGARPNGIDRRTNEDAFETQQIDTSIKSNVPPDGSNFVKDRNYNSDKSIPVLEHLYGKHGIHDKSDGPKSKQELQRELLSMKSHQLKVTNGEMKPLSTSSEIDSVDSTSTLFVRNIESEQLFKEMIKPYHPVSYRVRQSKGKLIAFLEMGTEEKAQEAIDGLNKKLQKTRCLEVYKDRNKIDSVTVNSSGSSKAESVIVESYETPSQQVDFTDTSPSKHETKLGIEENFYRLDCRIIIANFHPNILASELQKAFEKYHLVDFCMLNNGFGPGHTKAILYLRSIYDVVGALHDMNRSFVLGGPLQIDVPEENIIEKAFIDKELSKCKASSYKYSPSIHMHT